MKKMRSHKKWFEPVVGVGCLMASYSYASRPCSGRRESGVDDRVLHSVRARTRARASFYRFRKIRITQSARARARAREGREAGFALDRAPSSFFARAIRGGFGDCSEGRGRCGAMGLHVVKVVPLLRKGRIASRAHAHAHARDVRKTSLTA